MSAMLWLGTYGVHSTVLLGLALLLRRRLRRTSSAETIWRSAMLLPLFSATAFELIGSRLWAIRIAASVDAALGSPEPAGRGIAFALGSAQMAAIVWLVVGAVLIGRDLAARRLFVRRLGGRTPVDEAVAASVADLVGRVNLRRDVAITCSSAARSPVVLGRSEICLPVRALRDLTRRELRALVGHELAHLLRRDNAWFLGIGWLESLLFMQPFNRMARRELHWLAETACDDWAARQLSDPTAMAHCLVEVAGWVRTRLPRGMAAVVGAGSLTERVERLLEDAPTSAVPVSRPLSFAALVMIALSLPGFAQSPPAPARQVTGEDVLPAVFGPRSPEFVAGFAAGQRFAEGRVDASLRSLLEQGSRQRIASPSASGTQGWRAELERQLIAKRDSR